MPASPVDSDVKGLTAPGAILEVLRRGLGETYGLALRDTVFALTHGTLNLKPGTLYPALAVLEREGLVVSHPETAAPKRGGRPKIFYTLTPKGRAQADELRLHVANLYSLWDGLTPPDPPASPPAPSETP